MTLLSAFLAYLTFPFLAVSTVRHTSKSPKPISDKSQAFWKISVSSRPSGRSSFGCYERLTAAWLATELLLERNSACITASYTMLILAFMRSPKGLNLGVTNWNFTSSSYSCTMAGMKI